MRVFFFFVLGSERLVLVCNGVTQKRESRDFFGLAHFLQELVRVLWCFACEFETWVQRRVSCVDARG